MLILTDVLRFWRNECFRNVFKQTFENSLSEILLTAYIVYCFARDELESRRACQRSGKQENFITSVRSQEEFTI